MSKKKGSTLIETIVAVNIIMMMFLVVTMLIASNRANYYKRRKIEEASRVVYCIMQEIKYNSTLEEIIDLTNKNSLELQNYDEFLFDLSDLDLEQMPKGNDIIITTTPTEDEDKIKVKIKINLLSKNESLERSFFKYRWMDYYE